MVQRQSQRPSRNPAPGVTRNTPQGVRRLCQTDGAPGVPGDRRRGAVVNEGYLYSTIDEHYKATA